MTTIQDEVKAPSVLPATIALFTSATTLVCCALPAMLVMLGMGAVWSGVIGVSEHLGSDTFFHVHDTGLAETITIRADGEVGLNHGDTVYLTPREDMIHRFDANGLRIA